MKRKKGILFITSISIIIIFIISFCQIKQFKFLFEIIKLPYQVTFIMNQLKMLHIKMLFIKQEIIKKLL